MLSSSADRARLPARPRGARVGTSRATAGTLRRIWASNLNLKEFADTSDRARDLAEIERFVLDHLPPAMRAPSQLAEAVLAWIEHAPSVLGSIIVRGVLDPEPCSSATQRAPATAGG